MEDFPNRPIRIVTSHGGGIDLLTHLIAKGISGPLGQAVTVDNQATNLTIECVAKASPDGYTLLAFPQTFWIGPLLQDTTYDPVTDFSPITLAATSPLIVVVHPSVAASSVGELIALARARPGQLSYVAGLNGSSAQLAGALLTYMAGVNVVRIPYEGGGSAGLDDLIAGKVQLMILSAGAAASHIKSGKLKALAVTSSEPSALAAGLPTVAASGVPGYEVVQTIGVFAPAKTPATVIQRLNHEIARFLKTTEAKENLLKAGLEAVGSTPAQLAAMIKTDMAKWAKIIREVGIRAN